MTPDFTFVFLLFFGLTVAVRLWLKLRHIRYVASHRNAVPAEFAERIALADHQKAADYTVDRSKAAILHTLIDASVLLAFTLGGGLTALHEVWSSQLDGLAYGLAMIFSIMIISGLIDLPLSLYSQFVIEARHGFNRMTLGLFFTDLLKQTVLGLAIGAPVIAAVLWLMGAMGEYWWLYVWLFWSGFNLLIMFIYPTWIAPLFNKFSPLEDGEMKSRIEALLTRCGFRSSGLFVMDGSKRSSHGNAYFTGFGNNKRIVFFDTLLARLQPAEVEAVLAHELGHFRKKHVVKRMVLMFAGSLAFLWLLGQLIDAPWFYAGLGVPAQNTTLALILFFLVMPVFTFPLGPLMSHLSRRHEFEADAYAAQHASASDLVQALVKLYQDNASTLTPDPLHSLFHDSHPPAAQRIAHLQAQEKTA
ncbi:MAG: M48 family metallopeptidase [Gammaproteobacteria bacterium]|nr:M48 family metallopeptidase [Gammaproteobacteria bacterium]MBU1601584.1 M48 family metallopeptidase [Gammaproteobacteria bacterium]MBU2434662.1 M48 family metallopeptidase [Gammaproteobacteria bacterium]MBU2447903.1 M48 family metallopeptidase [Gammaproteobacteria bacterium]